jgi:hypothetical protein
MQRIAAHATFLIGSALLACASFAATPPEATACSANPACSQALAQALDNQARSSTAEKGLNNGSLCNPSSCIVMVCDPPDSPNCVVWWCTPAGCKKVNMAAAAQ